MRRAIHGDYHFGDVKPSDNALIRGIGTTYIYLQSPINDEKILVQKYEEGEFTSKKIPISL